MRRFALLLALIAVTALAPAVAAGAASRASGATSGSLTYLMVAQSWPTLTPASAAEEGSEQPIMSLIYGGLFNVGRHDTVQPGLATAYKVTNGGLSLALSLRPNVRFQDGTPFDATAVKESLLRDENPANGCNCASFLASIQSITTPSPEEVVLTLSAPDGSLPAALAGSSATFIPSPTALQSEGSKFGLSPVGAGPFRVMNNTPSSSITLTRWPGYWDSKRVHLSTIKVVSESSDTTALDTVEGGTAQLVTSGVGDPGLVHSARETSGLRVTTSNLGAEFIYLNLTKPPFNNISARRALQYATNQATITQAVLYNSEPASQVLIGPAMLGYPGSHLPGYPSYSVSKAKALARQVGGISFTLIPLRGTDQWEVLEAEALKREWAEAGIQASITLENEPQVLQGLEGNNTQAVIAGYPAQLSGLLAMDTVLTCKSLFDPGYCDPKVDQAMAAGRHSYSVPAQARALRQAMDQAIVKDAAFVPLAVGPTIAVSKHSVSGLVLQGNMIYVDHVSLG